MSGLTAPKGWTTWNAGMPQCLISVGNSQKFAVLRLQDEKDQAEATSWRRQTKQHRESEERMESAFESYRRDFDPSLNFVEGSSCINVSWKRVPCPFPWGHLAHASLFRHALVPLPPQASLFGGVCGFEGWLALSEGSAGGGLCQGNEWRGNLIPSFLVCTRFTRIHIVD